MREIKFRAWSEKHNEMWDCDHLALNRVSVSTTGRGCIGRDEDGVLELLPWLKPLEYTGLKDKNGKEIYEGDIIETTKGIRYVVFWSEAKTAFAGRTHNVFKKWGPKKSNGGEPRQTKWLYKSLSYLSEYAVIGNIYENPELLHSQENPPQENTSTQR